MIIVEHDSFNAGSFDNIQSSGDYIVIYYPNGLFTIQNVNSQDPMEQVQSLVNVLNEIINDGYKLLTPDVNNNALNRSYILVVPWTTVGLTEIDSSELGLRISPNPAKKYINVEVDFTSQPSELVLISEQGYIYFKKDISNILSGQEFAVDISNVPAGKYLVTVKNDKQYLTPKKLIVF